MKNLIFLLSIVFLASCEGVDIKPGPGPLVQHNTIGDDGPKAKENVINPMYNIAPGMEGSDFGNFFNLLYRQGKFDEMVKFTSSSSIDEYGEDVVRDFYENDLKFGYEIGKPHSMTESGDTITLNYNANIIATKRVFRVKILIENDSCKIILPINLNKFPS